MFRHEQFRKYQKEFALDVEKAVKNQKILLAEAPTGMGKTDAVIGAAIETALNKSLSLFFLTPKISQHSIAMDVVDGLNKKYKLGLKAIDVVGRRYMCIHPALTNLDQESFYPACERLRKKELCPYHRKAIGYTKEKSIKANEILKSIKNEVELWRYKDIINASTKHEVCPYEVMSRLAVESNIVIADYYHIFIPKVREIFMQKIKKSVEKSIVIVDEAHNLPSRIRQHLSTTFNSRLASKIDKELEMLGYEKLSLKRFLKKFIDKHLDKDGEILGSSDEFIDAIDSEYGYEFLMDMSKEVGWEFVEKANQRSALLRFYTFLEKMKNEDVSSIIILKRKGSLYSISKKSLDPSIYASILNKFYAGILMSGTLRPMDMYIDVLGIDKTRVITKTYPSPFPKENRLYLMVDGLTTRYSKRSVDEYKRYAEYIDKIIDASPGGVAVFFPSYKVLNGVLPFIKHKTIAQKEKMKPTELHSLIESFKKNRGVLLAVQGGSLAEGIDFNKGEIKVAIIVGLALEEMSIEIKSLIDYYENKFGKGWEYGYLYPAVIKAMQAAGRAIRKEDDRAVIVFMDERFKWQNYKKLLPNEHYVITKEPWIYVKQFFG